MQTNIVEVADVRELLERGISIRTLTTNAYGQYCSAEVMIYGDVSITTNNNDTAVDNLLNLPPLYSDKSVKIDTVTQLDAIEYKLRLRHTGRLRLQQLLSRIRSL